MYQLAELLLQLGAGPCVSRLSESTPTSCPSSTLVDAAVLLLRYGADPSHLFHHSGLPGALMHTLVEEQRLDVLQQLYDQAPSSMMDVDYFMRFHFLVGSILDVAQERLKDAKTDEAKQRVEAIVALLEKERNKIMDLDQILLQYEAPDRHNDNNNNSSNSSSSSSSSSVTATARYDNVSIAAMVEADGEEETKHDLAVSVSGGNDRVSQSDASHYPQHDHHHVHDNEEYEFELERRTFTRRLFRNLGHWSQIDWTKQQDCHRSQSLQRVGHVDQEHASQNAQRVGRVALMFVEDSKRIVGRSLIDLKQTDADDRDVVQLLCRHYVGACRVKSSMVDSTSEPTVHVSLTISIIHTIIWPRLLQVIRHQQYDINRCDKYGWSALTYLVCRNDWHEASASKHKYDLLESLLQLGANPSQPSGQWSWLHREPHDSMREDGRTPLVHLAYSGMDPEMTGIKLLLRYGADIHATNAYGSTFIHLLLSGDQLHSLDYLYTHYPNVMFTVDYTHTYPARSAHSIGSIMSVADYKRQRSITWRSATNVSVNSTSASTSTSTSTRVTTSSSTSATQAQQQSDSDSDSDSTPESVLLNRLETERNKQRQLIQQQLSSFTPLIPDLTGIITEYITPKNWRELQKS